MLMLKLLQAAASGVVTGCIYAMIALSVVIIYKATEIVNFAGGELVMVGAWLGLLLVGYFGLPRPVMLLAVPVVLFVLGAAFDRLALGRIARRRPSRRLEHATLVVATIGLSNLLKGAVRGIPYTQEVRRLPPLIGGAPIFVGDVVLERQDLAIVALAAVVMLALWAFFRYTLPGKALRATSQNARAAALVGIPVAGMRMSVWGLAASLSGLAGVMLAPKLLLTPDMGDVVTLAFAAAIIGGFTSLPGCVVGGAILGIMQNLVGTFIAPQAIAVTPFFVIMLVLLLRPQGLFGDTVGVRRV